MIYFILDYFLFWISFLSVVQKIEGTYMHGMHFALALIIIDNKVVSLCIWIYAKWDLSEVNTGNLVLHYIALLLGLVSHIFLSG